MKMAESAKSLLSSCTIHWRTCIANSLDFVGGTHQNKIWTVLLLIVIGIVSSGAFSAPVLYSDDWSSFVEPMVDMNVSWLDWTSRRPLELAPRRLLFDLFGLNLSVSYVVLGILNVVAAIQFYFLVLHFFPRVPAIASVAGIIMLAAPVDYTRTWLTMIHIRMAMCLLLLYAWLISNYIERGQYVFLVSALLSLGLSLGMYEAQLGLALAWCLCLMAIKREVKWGRRLATLSPLFIGLGFLVWRTFGITRAGISDNYLGEMQLSPGVIFGRLALGFKVLAWGWTEPLHQILGFGTNWLPMAILFLCIAFFWFSIILLDRRLSCEDGSRFRGWQQNLEIRELVIMLVAGIVFIVAGYLPIGLLYEPNLDGLASRVNLFAQPGASVVIVSLLCGGALLVARNRQQIRTLLWAGSAPLIILGVLTQVWVQYDIRDAWVEQKEIWADLFDLVPNLADDTTVCFVLAGYQDRVGFAHWQRTPLSSNWEVTAALRVLYGNDSLRGELLFLDLETYGEAVLTAHGVVDFRTGSVTSYDRALFVIYEEHTGQLRLLEDLQSLFPVTWPTSTYVPHERITGTHAPEVLWRWLVGASSAPGSRTR